MGAITRLAAMPGTNRLPPFLALLFVLAALSGCGSDEISGEIPPDDAAELKSALAGVRAEIEAGCTDPDQAQAQAQAFVNAVNALPEDPSAGLKPELQDAADHLRTLVDSECASTEPPTTTQSTTPTTPTTSAETSTSDTSTTETSTTSTSTTTSTDEPPPPGNGNGPPGDGPPGPPGDGGTGGTGGGTGDETGD